MTIKRHKRGNSIYLSKYRSGRVNGKVKSEFIGYLGVEENGEIAKAPVKTIDNYPAQVSQDQATSISDRPLPRILTFPA